MVWLMCKQECCRKVVSMRHVERQRGKHGAVVMILRSPRSRAILRSRIPQTPCASSPYQS